MITPLPKELAMFAASGKQLDDLLEIVRAYGAAEYKRGITEAMSCYSPDDSATDWMDKIRKLGEKS